MSNASLKLSDLLPGDIKVDPAELNLEKGKSLSPSLMGFLGSKVQESVGSALNLDVLEVIAQAWSKADELKEASGAMRAPGEVKQVYLAKHDVVCENKLNVALEFAGVPAVTDHLQLTLTAKFEGVGLTIGGGYIVAIDGGRGAAQVELRYSNTKLIGRTTDWVKLPSKLTLARPIQIAGFAQTNVVPLRGVAGA